MDHQPSITFLNYTGDVTITWEPDQLETIERMVEKMMKQGYTFFIEKPVLFGLVTKKQEVQQARDVRKAKNLNVPNKVAQAFLDAMNDPTLADAIQTGKAQLTKPHKLPAEGVELTHSRDVKEITRSKSTALKPIVGG